MQLALIYAQHTHTLIFFLAHSQYSNLLTNIHLFSPEGRGFVNISIGFSFQFTYVSLHLSHAQPYRTKWKAIWFEFFLSIGAGTLVLASIDWLYLYIFFGILTCYATHPYLIIKSSYIFNGMIHCNKLTSKGTCFTWSLLLGNPTNWSFIQENNKTSSLSSIDWVSNVIVIHIYSHPESQFSGSSHIRC